MARRASTAGVWGTIDSQRVAFPTTSHDVSLLQADFAVPSDVVRTLLPDHAVDVLELLEVEPGQAALSLVLADHVKTDWGPFRAATLVTHVCPREAGPADRELGTFVLAGATGDVFQNEILYWVLGLPHDGDAIVASYEGDDVTFRVTTADQGLMTVGFPRGSAAGSMMTVSGRTYGVVDDRVFVVPYDVTMSPVPVDPSTVRMSLGGGHFGDTLRLVGMPSATLTWAWAAGSSMTFHYPNALDGR